MENVRSPLQAQIVQWLVAPGDAVRQGDVLVVLEAMKMEHELRAGADAQVLELLFAAGDVVQADELLLRVAPLPAKPVAAPDVSRPEAPTAQVRPDLQAQRDRDAFKIGRAHV